MMGFHEWVHMFQCASYHHTDYFKGFINECMDANIWTWGVGGNNLPSHFVLTEKCEKNEKRLYVKQITTIFFYLRLTREKKITLYHDYLNTQISFGLQGGNINSKVKIPV